MLNRAFRKREKAMLLLLAVALLCLFYYQFVKKPVERSIIASDTTYLDMQIAEEELKAGRIRAMQEEMAENLDGGNGYVSTYNNFNAVANTLNEIFKDSEEFRFDFKQPVAAEDVVRREIGITFTAGNYRIARAMLQSLHDQGYRCLIKNINLTAAGDYRNTEKRRYLRNSPVSGSLSVIFYETLYDAVTEEGLRYADGSTPGERKGLANSDVSGISRSELETAAESWASSVLYGQGKQNPYSESYIAEGN